MAFQVSTSDKATQARELLERRFDVGQAQQDALIKRVADTHIIDKLVSPKATAFSVIGKKPKLQYMQPPAGVSAKNPAQLFLAIPGDAYGIHPHALSQMCKVAGIPKTYINRLLADEAEEWEHRLFEHNMNTLFHHGKYLDRSRKQTRFLHRIVGNEVRGFLSRNFNRHLASLPLLGGFIDACQGVAAKPVEASTSDVRFHLKCFLPYVFEPVEGEFVAFGATWSNSDFGAGRLQVALSTLRISSGTTAVLDDIMSRVHIGSVIQDSDLEISDATAAKEVDTQVSAIQDAVKTQLAPEAINRMVDIIAAAHEEQIPWRRLRGELGRLLQKQEIENVKKLLESAEDSIIDLPPAGRTSGGDPIATRWWASNAISMLARNEPSADRQNELQQLAGELIGKKVSAA